LAIYAAGEDLGQEYAPAKATQAAADRVMEQGLCELTQAQMDACGLGQPIFDGYKKSRRKTQLCTDDKQLSNRRAIITSEYDESAWHAAVAARKAARKAAQQLENKRRREEKARLQALSPEGLAKQAAKDAKKAEKEEQKRKKAEEKAEQQRKKTEEKARKKAEKAAAKQAQASKKRKPAQAAGPGPARKKKRKVKAGVQKLLDLLQADLDFARERSRATTGPLVGDDARCADCSILFSLLQPVCEDHVDFVPEDAIPDWHSCGRCEVHWCGLCKTAEAAEEHEKACSGPN
jgi:chemotaxis protein histidine kinase CheA